MASTAWTTPVVNVVSQKKPAYPFHQSNTKSLSLLSKHKHPFLSLPKSSNPPHFFTNTRAFKVSPLALSFLIYHHHSLTLRVIYIYLLDSSGCFFLKWWRLCCYFRCCTGAFWLALCHFAVCSFTSIASPPVKYGFFVTICMNYVSVCVNC